MTHGDLHEVVMATNNAGKAREISAVLAEYGIKVLPQSQFNVPEAEETGLTFVENALLKARNAAQYSKHPVIADDSGIAVDALDGQPGIYSARYAGVGAGDEANNAKLLQALAGLPPEQRGARFICVMVLLRHALDPTPIICQGVWEGRVLEAPSGANGFGYDPLFFVPGENCASAQLPAERKNQLSHRGQALRALVAEIRRQLASGALHV